MKDLNVMVILGQLWPDDGFGVALATLLALAAALAVHWAGRKLLHRVAQPYRVPRVLLRFVDRPAQLALVALSLQFIWGNAPDELMFTGVLQKFSLLALVGALTWLAMRCVAGVAQAVIELHPLDISDNMSARSVHTQTRVLARCLMGLISVIGFGAMLMTLPSVRELGTSLLASAGVAGLVAGIAARPVLGNLIAGLQIALSQPVRIDDVVVIQGEWGRIEEITGTYVSVRIWDQRRLIIPLQWLIENPFQNWTRKSSEIIGTVFLWVDYALPLEPLREAFQKLCEASDEWDRRVSVLQVTDANERAMQLRMLVSSADSGLNFSLRCHVREGMLDFIQKHYPEALPRVRTEWSEIPAVV
ncbi:MAG: mechanosensitive ion channel family protein [Janthinobacterium lividum]